MMILMLLPTHRDIDVLKCCSQPCSPPIFLLIHFPHVPLLSCQGLIKCQHFHFFSQERESRGTMHPRFVFALLGLILSFTTTIYYVRIPSDLRSGLSNRSNTGYWGVPNAEFDWCEYNYKTFFHIAEPVNSFSMISFFYVICRIFKQLRSILRSCTHAHLLLFEIGLVAIGSFAFHATLQYEMQLADELPMLALVLHAAYVLYCRPTAASNKRVERHLLLCSLFLFTLTTTLGLIFTNRSQALHTFFRGCTTYSFSAAFLYIFVAQSAAAADLDKRFPSTAVDTFSGIFNKGFFWFILAILAWIAENVGCSVLQNLPLSIPFPHFHGLIWHFGCAAGSRDIF